MDEAVDDIVHVPEWAALPSPRARQLWRAIVLSVALSAQYRNVTQRAVETTPLGAARPLNLCGEVEQRI